MALQKEVYAVFREIPDLEAWSGRKFEKELERHKLTMQTTLQAGIGPLAGRTPHNIDPDMPIREWMWKRAENDAIHLQKLLDIPAETERRMEAERFWFTAAFVLLAAALALWSCL